MSKAIYAALLAVQQGLKAPKDKSGGKYKYRSAEDIFGEGKTAFAGKWACDSLG